MITEDDLACAWCDGRPCVGDGYLNDAGAGDACGATDHHRDGATIEADALAHACEICGAYACGIHCLDDGLCPSCDDTDAAREVVASGQKQSRFLS